MSDADFVEANIPEHCAKCEKVPTIGLDGVWYCYDDFVALLAEARGAEGAD